MAVFPTVSFSKRNLETKPLRIQRMQAPQRRASGRAERHLAEMP